MVRRLLVFAALLLSSSAWAQNALAPGDIAFTAYRADDPDAFGFLTLADLPGGETIKFTDRGWTGSDFRIEESGELEGVLLWTVPTGGVSARTEVFITFDGGLSASVGGVALVDGDFELNHSYGDTILAYQGSDSDPSFVNGIGMNDAGWSPGAATAHSSVEPSAIADVEVSMAEIDNAAYDCAAPTTGTRQELLDDLRDDVAHWIKNQEPFDVTAGCTWPPEGCGDGTLDEGEVCDGSELGDGSCVDEGYSNAAGVQCNDTCDGFDYSNCTNDCGDGQTEPGEDCDTSGTDTASCDYDCTDVSCGDGYCNPTVEDAESCPGDCPASCGDGLISGSEVCDSTDLDGATCASEGFDDGTLACAGDCLSYDTAACTWTCGNDSADGDEACDGADLAGQDCTDHGFTTPDGLACGDDCATVDTSGCTPTCGDGTVEPGEACDDGNTEAGDGCSPTCDEEEDSQSSVGRCACSTTAPASASGLVLLLALAGLRRRRPRH